MVADYPNAVKADGWLRIVGYGVKGMDENTIEYCDEWMGL